MSASKRRCKFDLTQLVAFCTNFERTCPIDCSFEFLDVKKQELERRWVKLVTSYEEYVLVGEEPDGEDHKDEVSLRYEEASDLYQTLKTKILEKMKKTSVEHKEPTTIKSTLKLPACEIQNFEGGYARWPAFRDMFQAVIGKLCGFH